MIQVHAIDARMMPPCLVVHATLPDASYAEQTATVSRSAAPWPRLADNGGVA
jgi:hypothetical protein